VVNLHPLTAHIVSSYTHKMAQVSWPQIVWRHFTLSIHNCTSTKSSLWKNARDLAQQGPDVRWPRRCCPLASQFEYMHDRTDRRTNGHQTDAAHLYCSAYTVGLPSFVSPGRNPQGSRRLGWTVYVEEIIQGHSRSTDVLDLSPHRHVIKLAQQAAGSGRVRLWRHYS